MEIKTELCDLAGFDAWSGGVYTKEIIVNAGKGREFLACLEDIYPDGMTETDLNDLLWFEPEWCLELVGINETDDEEESE